MQLMALDNIIWVVYEFRDTTGKYGTVEYSTFRARPAHYVNKYAISVVSSRTLSGRVSVGNVDLYVIRWGTDAYCFWVAGSMLFV
jgi:hypothetical protein